MHSNKLHNLTISNDFLPCCHTPYGFSIGIVLRSVIIVENWVWPGDEKVLVWSHCVLIGTPLLVGHKYSLMYICTYCCSSTLFCTNGHCDRCSVTIYDLALTLLNILLGDCFKD